jgi:arginine repressor
VKQLQLLIGDDTVTIWPADPDEIEALGKQLIKIAEKLMEDG